MAGNRSIPRRTFLSAASAGGLAVAGGLVLAGCSDSADKARKAKIEQLQPLLSDALSDEAAARQLIAGLPDRAAALTVIATERKAHADAVLAEMTTIDSARGKDIADHPTFTTPTASATIDSLRQQLRASAKHAGDVAINAEGYRAGLCGSISAAVTTQLQVQLA